SHVAKFGGRIDPVKDAIGRFDERPLQATGCGTGFSGASKARVLARIEPASPIMLGLCDEWRNLTLTGISK
ncbi:MAG: hypothetical protein ACREQT_01055, partial [Candidatus Binataceae bacterium]